MKTVNFWNGNKSAERKVYERELLSLVLQHSKNEYANASLLNDQTDYPTAEDEGAIFARGTDICVTVAGNPKFPDGSYTPIFEPLLNGLLGHRLLIVRDSDAREFSQMRTAEHLKQKRIGIPATWADANLFRDNSYLVSEKGTLDDLFHRLKSGECDYVALGINEIDSIFQEFAQPLGGLMLEPTLRLYYPFALVFYVNPNQKALVQSIKRGLETIKQTGAMSEFFYQYYHATICAAALNKRAEITLNNRSIPCELTSVLQHAKKTILR